MSARLRERAWAVRGPIVAGSIGLLLIAWLATATARRVYLEPAAALRTDIARERGRLSAVERVVADGPRVRRRLDEAVARSLGASIEEVDHRLRSRLNRLAERSELVEASAGTGNATARRSPARSRLAREMRDEVDFVELEGWVSGEGSLEQAVRLVDALDAEPWIKRLTQVRLDPRDNGERFRVAVRLVTLFVPERGPDRPPERAYDPARVEAFDALLAANPFRLPPPVAARPEPEPPPVAPPPPRPAFPWGQWALTGIAEGPDGGEAWLRNLASGESRRLAIGHAIDEAVFRGATRDWAEFRIEDERFRVRVGASLSDRSPVSE